MIIPDKNDIFKIKKLTDADFNRLSSLIYNELGMKMPSQKKVLLEGRLHKRLRELNFQSFKEYIDFVLTEGEYNGELVTMFDLVTTNKTDFFRESKHFDFFSSTFLVDYYNKHPKQTLKIWSAGCSSGEEVYTLGMIIQEFKENNPNFDYQIFGSDISMRMLHSASLAIYPDSRIGDIPYNLKKKYLLKNKDQSKRMIRIAPELREKTTFFRHNLMEENYNNLDMFDAIFCRNVLIYFDSNTQKQVIRKLTSNLKQGGYLFLGHSETVNNATGDLLHIQPSVYLKK